MEKSDEKIHWYETLPHKEQKKIQKEGDADVSQYQMKKLNKDVAAKIHAEKYGNDLKIWLKSIAKQLGMQKREDIALQVLRAGLHALRDRMVLEEVFDLSAQLPTLIRGIYFENYRPHDKPAKSDLEELLNGIDEQIITGNELSPEMAFEAVVKELHAHVSRGELKDIYNTMPSDIKKFWNNCILDQQF